MKENIKYLAKLTSTSLLTFIKINLLSIVSTALFTIVGLILLFKDREATQSAHVSAIPFLITVFLAKPVSSVLFYGTLLASPFIFFTLGNKYITSKLIHTVINDKSEEFISPIISKMAATLKEKTNFSVNESEKISSLKHSLSSQLNSENKLVKRIVGYGIEKINLDTVDFSQDNQSVTEQIKARLMQALKDVQQPSKKNIWLFLLFQWVLLVIIQLIPY